MTVLFEAPFESLGESSLYAYVYMRSGNSFEGALASIEVLKGFMIFVWADGCVEILNVDDVVRVQVRRKQ